MNLRDPITGAVVLQASDAKVAEEYQKVIAKATMALMVAAKKELPDEKSVPELKPLLELLKPKVEKDKLVWKVEERSALQALAPVAAKMRAAAARMESSNNLKQIALALHNFHDTYRNFPAVANYSKDGKPLLSWRVHILPYIEQEQLYRQFKLDEPWDSPHNKKLIAQMPKTYREPKSKAPAGKTTYLAPVGKGTIFGPKPAKITEIRDGTSNTIMIVEADDDKAVFWTKPDDLPVSEKAPLKGLGANGHFQAAFADGSVRVFSRDIAPATLWALFTKDGREVVPNE
jgi:hypothetical protein